MRPPRLRRRTIVARRRFATERRCAAALAAGGAASAPEAPAGEPGAGLVGAEELGGTGPVPAAAAAASAAVVATFGALGIGFETVAGGLGTAVVTGGGAGRGRGAGATGGGGTGAGRGTVTFGMDDVTEMIDVTVVGTGTSDGPPATASPAARPATPAHADRAPIVQRRAMDRLFCHRSILSLPTTERPNAVGGYGQRSPFWYCSLSISSGWRIWRNDALACPRTGPPSPTRRGTAGRRSVLFLPRRLPRSFSLACG
jgi:hypothetical protein